MGWVYASSGRLVPAGLGREPRAAGRVYVTDGNQFFNRPGPRLVESAEILAACVHPDLFGGLRRKHADHVVRVTRGLEVVPIGG